MADKKMPNNVNKATDGTELKRPKNIIISDTKFTVDGKPKFAKENTKKKKENIGIIVTNPR